MYQRGKNQRGKRENEVEVRHGGTGRVVLASILGARDLQRVVFYGHGFPASRLEAGVAHGIARSLGLTIVALDRPGFGGSDWYKGRRLEDWADDVALVANHLGVGKFALLGVSGGTPSVVAAAAQLHERVTSLNIVSGVCPIQYPGVLEEMNGMNKLILRAGGAFPMLGCLALGTLALLWRTVPKTAQLWFRFLLPKPDLAVWHRPEISKMFARSIREGLKQGPKGVVTDFQLLLSDWREIVKRVRIPCLIWHGDADTYVPFHMGKTLAAEIAGASFHAVSGGGHFMVVDHVAEILSRIE
jgi:pimeloyl-ACP methyl ester carboxylesterase